MFHSTKMAVAIACTGMASIAAADTIDLNYTGVVGGTGAAQARIGSTTYYSGHMAHQITSGPQSGQTFNTFCIEIGEFAANGSATYEIVDLADAPAPGSPYGQSKADAVSAVIANAHAMGWIDGRLQATDSSDPLYLAKMGAIQAAVWEALGHDFQLNSGATSSTLRDQYNILMSVQSFDGSMRMANLMAAVAPGQQDQLYVVPLPTAAWAGLGMLGLCAGVRTIRRR